MDERMCPIISDGIYPFFILQSKSPFSGGGFSPLPSPASVGSTASTGSGGGGASDSSSSTVSVPRQIYNRAAEHLTVATHVHTCLELWRLSDSYMDQCRGRRTSGLPSNKCVWVCVL